MAEPTPHPAPVLTVDVAIVGAGPAGLMAAEHLSAAGLAVHLFDAMPSVGRKFLLAGKGGLNLTHAEPLERFIARYGARAEQVTPWLNDFGPADIRAWAAGLGVETFVGSSQRVFPAEMKAAPLLRAWLQRLRHPPAGGVPVRFHMRHRWEGWVPDQNAIDSEAVHDDSTPTSGLMGFASPAGTRLVRARATLLALGGASWPRLGSDGAWQTLLAARGVRVAPLKAANSGFDVAGAGGAGWSAFLRQRFAGQPLKSVAITLREAQRELFRRQGECVLTETGLEGSLVYAASALLREAIERDGHAVLGLDLLPARTLAQVRAALKAPRGTQSLSNHLRRQLRLEGVKAALLRELLPAEVLGDMDRLAEAIKDLPVTLNAARPVAEAISSAGGVDFGDLDENLQLHPLPGCFCAGEMLDWEAPTGGYLLTACLASGVRAAHGVRRWLSWPAAASEHAQKR